MGLVLIYEILCTAVQTVLAGRITLRVKGGDIASYGKPISELRSVICRMGSHSVTPLPRHRWTRPALTPVRWAGTRFTYPEEIEGWADLSGWLHTKIVYPLYLPASSHLFRY